MIISLNYTLAYLHGLHNFSPIIASKKLFIDLILNAVQFIVNRRGSCPCIILLFFTEDSSINEEKLMKFLTGSYRTPVLGALPSIHSTF